MLWVSKSKVYASGKFYYESVVSLCNYQSRYKFKLSFICILEWIYCKVTYNYHFAKY